MEHRSIGADAIVGSGSPRVSSFWTLRSFNKEASVFILFCFLHCLSKPPEQSTVCFRGFLLPFTNAFSQACLQWVFYCPTCQPYWGSRHCPHLVVQPWEHTPAQREKVYGGETSGALERNIAVLGASWGAWLGCRDGCMAQPVWASSWAGTACPLAAIALQTAGPTCSVGLQPAARVLVVVLPCSQPEYPHHRRPETVREERRSSPAAEAGDSCQTVSKRRHRKTHLGAVERFVCRWVEICVAEYQQTGITLQNHPISI